VNNVSKIKVMSNIFFDINAGPVVHSPICLMQFVLKRFQHVGVSVMAEILAHLGEN
jgi:hypothetical protein